MLHKLEYIWNRHFIIRTCYLRTLTHKLNRKSSKRKYYWRTSLTLQLNVVVGSHYNQVSGGQSNKYITGDVFFLFEQFRQKRKFQGEHPDPVFFQLSVNFHYQCQVLYKIYFLKTLLKVTLILNNLRASHYTAQVPCLIIKNKTKTSSASSRNHTKQL